MRGGFHWRDGWYFRRTEDGSVEVTKTDPKSDDPNFQFEIPPEEWASIVCSVSAGGETGERWEAAQDFHGHAQ